MAASVGGAMRFERESALRGVLWSGVLGAGTRGVSFVRQLVVTATFGLTAPVDGFVAALTIAVAVTGLGIELLDGAGVPELIRARADSVDRFRTEASRMLGASLVGSAAAALLLLVAAPAAASLVPGFDAEGRSLTIRNLRLLAPYVAAFGPYYCLGGVFRAARRFRVFLLAELGVAIASLALLWWERSSWWAIAGSLALAQVLGLVVLAIYARARLGVSLAARAGDGEAIAWAGPMRGLVPIFLVAQIFPLTDRAVASFLGAGAVSALWFATLLALLPPVVFNVKSLSVTPLTESTDRGGLLTTMTSMTMVVGLPIGLFVFLRAEPIVSWLFERRSFDGDDARRAAEAFRWFGLGMPLLFLWPVCLRLLQILGRFRFLLGLTTICMAVNGLLDFGLALALGWDVAGIALATGVSYALLVVAALFEASRQGAGIDLARVTGATWPTLVAAFCALAVSMLVERAGAGMPWNACAYVVSCGLGLSLLRSSETERIGAVVLASSPLLSAWSRRLGVVR